MKETIDKYIPSRILDEQDIKDIDDGFCDMESRHQMTALRELLDSHEFLRSQLSAERERRREAELDYDTLLGEFRAEQSRRREAEQLLRQHYGRALRPSVKDIDAHFQKYSDDEGKDA